MSSRVNGFRNSTIAKNIQTFAEAKIEAKRVEALKTAVESWITQTVEGDAAIGRKGTDFGVSPSASVSQADRRALLERGVVCYQGSGNYFQADLTGDNARILHRRPLAQRFVELIPGGNA